MVTIAHDFSTESAALTVVENRRFIDGRLTVVLRSWPGTVTAFLEALAGELIDAVVLSQVPALVPMDNSFGLAGGDEVANRAVFLSGVTTGTQYVYAESVMAVGRLPATVRDRLEHSRDPIGRVLTNHGLEIERKDLSGSSDEIVPHRGGTSLVKGAVFARRSLLSLGGTPVMDVSEWFLRPVADLLRSQSE